MSTTSLLVLAVLSLLSLSLASPIPDDQDFKPPFLSDAPRTRRTYSPTTHSRDNHAAIRNFPTSIHSPPSRFVPSSPPAEPINKSQLSHPDSSPSFFSTIASALARVFNFQQYTLEPPPEQSFITETPADQETQIHPTNIPQQNVHQNRYSSLPIHDPTDTQHHLERAKRLVEDALSQVDASSNDDLSPQELFQMVHLWKRMFQAIEKVLKHPETPTIPCPPTSTSTQIDEEPPPGDPITKTDNIEEMRRSTLPDVKIALAQAEQLNKQRERERQMKVTRFDTEQSNDLDYTDDLPKSAPSYPTRLKLQMDAQKQYWSTLG